VITKHPDRDGFQVEMPILEFERKDGNKNVYHSYCHEGAWTRVISLSTGDVLRRIKLFGQPKFSEGYCGPVEITLSFLCKMYEKKKKEKDAGKDAKEAASEPGAEMGEDNGNYIPMININVTQIAGTKNIDPTCAVPHGISSMEAALISSALRGNMIPRPPHLKDVYGLYPFRVGTGNTLEKTGIYQLVADVIAGKPSNLSSRVDEQLREIIAGLRLRITKEDPDLDEKEVQAETTTLLHLLLDNEVMGQAVTQHHEREVKSEMVKDDKKVSYVPIDLTIAQRVIQGDSIVSESDYFMVTPPDVGSSGVLFESLGVVAETPFCVTLASFFTRADIIALGSIDPKGDEVFSGLDTRVYRRAIQSRVLEYHATPTASLKRWMLPLTLDQVSELLEDRGALSCILPAVSPFGAVDTEKLTKEALQEHMKSRSLFAINTYPKQLIRSEMEKKGWEFYAYFPVDILLSRMSEAQRAEHSGKPDSLQSLLTLFSSLKIIKESKEEGGIVEIFGGLLPDKKRNEPDYRALIFASRVFSPAIAHAPMVEASIEFLHTILAIRKRRGADASVLHTGETDRLTSLAEERKTSASASNPPEGTKTEDPEAKKTEDPEAKKSLDDQELGWSDADDQPDTSPRDS
jgi:hypothetical protein